MRTGGATTVSAPTTAPVGRATSGWHSGVGVLTGATLVVSGANYAMSIATARMLPAGEFASFAAGQSLLLVVGTGSVAALPWALARYLAGHDDTESAQRAMAFGLIGSAVQSLLLAVLGTVVGFALEGPGFGAATGLSAAAISLLAGPSGYLQGRHRLIALAGTRGVETGVRIAATLGLILLVARRADVALLAFPIGSAVALGYALRAGRDGFPLRRMPRSLAVELTRQALLLGGIQVLLTMLGALDTVYADAAGFSSATAASYQAAALLARVPLFFSSAISTASYTRLVAAGSDAEIGENLRRALRTYGWLTVPFIVGCLTLPARVADVFVPSSFGQTLDLLRVLSFSGALIGVINVVTTAHQARGRFRPCLLLLGTAVSGQAAGLLITGATGHVMLFAATGALLAAVAASTLVYDCRRWLAVPTWHLDRTAIAVVLAAVLVAVVALVVPTPFAWAAGMAALTGLSLLRAAAKDQPA